MNSFQYFNLKCLFKNLLKLKDLDNFKMKWKLTMKFHFEREKIKFYIPFFFSTKLLMKFQVSEMLLWGWGVSLKF